MDSESQIKIKKLLKIDEPKKYQEGNCEIYKLPNGVVHRTDGPAMIWPNGANTWYCKGKIHREDGPAIWFPSGTKEWQINGVRHRIDGPAVEWSNGSKEFWVNGLLVPSEYFYRHYMKKSLVVIAMIMIKDFIVSKINFKHLSDE